ncbi:hypothetical protein N7470_010194 [Penicillium chermesinum]|nr:hypothetical protein N7470_010194 [Penicillium chermesinum]
MPSTRRTSSAGAKTSRRAKSTDTSQGQGKNSERTGKISDLSKKSSKQKHERLPLNEVPTQVLDVYVFGTNCYGELGLGDLTKKSEILRPVLNAKLAANTVGVVHVAVGGVHSAALTRDNKILTWGVNDEGTLARDTKPDEPADADNARTANGDTESDDSDDDEVAINPKEATPMPVDSALFSERTVFTQLAASDSATFALTADGLVYGWGTFRGANGSIGFAATKKQEQRVPVLIQDVPPVIKIVAGAQHVLALTSTGTVFSWGCDEQHQLGRRRASRHHDSHPLVPEPCALPTGVSDIGVGLYHSFAVYPNGTVYAWGSNNFGQTGVSMSAGLNDADVAYPTEVRWLRKNVSVVSIFGGKDHSMAITDDGRCFIWGRIDNKALGIGLEHVSPSDIIHDQYDRPRILKQPTLLEGIKGKIIFATAGTDHSFVITESGNAYSWGFNAQSQAGQPGIDEVERPTLLESKYIKGKKLVAAAAGGQFSIVLGLAEE